MIEFCRVRVAMDHDIAAIDRCRILAFREKPDAEPISEEDIVCAKDPPLTRNLVVERNGHVVASQAVVIATTQDRLRALLRDSTIWHEQMPVIVTKRGSTPMAIPELPGESLRGRSYNKMLRYWMIRAAIAMDAKAVMGRHGSGTPLESFLRNIGFDVWPADLATKGEVVYKPGHHPIISRLRASQFSSALKTMETDERVTFSWPDDSLPFLWTPAELEGVQSEE